MGRRASDMSQHRPRLIEGLLLASRVGTAMLIHRHPDQVSRHHQPVACDRLTRLELYDVEAVELSVRTRRRRHVA